CSRAALSLLLRRPPGSPPFPYTTLFRSWLAARFERVLDLFRDRIATRRARKLRRLVRHVITTGHTPTARRERLRARRLRVGLGRSEERRVGKEGGGRRWREGENETGE